MSAPVIVLVFVAAAAIDYIGVRYQNARERRVRWHAGAWAVLYGAVAAVAYLAVARGNPWYIVPECAGFFAGTVLAVKPRPLA